jgi:hypothetical protein
MTFFISVSDALREYDGLTEVQILEIINQELASPYDEQGNQLTAEKFHTLVRQQTENDIHSLENQLATSLRRDLGWG